MKKKIFIRVFGTAALSVLLMFAFGIVAVSSNARAITKDGLVRQTRLACGFLHDSADFSGLSGAEANDAFRATVLDMSGNVLYESDTRSPLENHADREEVRCAIEGHPTTVERYSDTFGCKMTYYAEKTTLADGREVVVRLAVRSQSINAYITLALPLLLAILAVALGASVVLSRVLSDRVSAKITEVGDSLRSLNRGNYTPIRTDTSEPELYSVVGEINELSQSMHKNITALRREHDKLNTVLENIRQGIIAVDRQKKIVFANGCACRLFGAQDPSIGKDIVYLIDDLALCERIARHLEADDAWEYTYADKTLSVAVHRVAEDGACGEGFSIVIFTDMTAERAIARQKSDFFANASHELKTPVTVMQGLSEVLLAKDIPDKTTEKQIARIHSESLRLAALVSDMLKLSRLERGEQTPQVPQEVDLRSVAQEVLARLEEQMQKNGITASVEGNATLRTDAEKVFEIMENLCTNAVNYNRENGSITVSLAQTQQTVTLQVADTGIGIAKEHLPRLCERFYRVDESRSKKTGGTGLGLAIVKHICASEGADLSIESTVGVGTTVTVTFHPTAD